MGSLGAFDLFGLSGDEAGWPAGYLANGFGGEAAYFRRAVRRRGFAGLGRVADAGAGFGRWSPFLAEVNDEVVAFDRNPRGVELGRKLADRFALDNLRFEQADLAALPAADAAFDGVWCNNVLQFTDRGAVLREFNRVLPVGGSLAILMFNGGGGVLETFFGGYARGGLEDHGARFALQCLKNGPLHNGRANYGTIQSAQPMLAQFGFALKERPQARFRSRGTRIDGGEDLAALARRLESDAAFRDDFARRPRFADAFPVTLDLLAIKRRDLAAA